MVSTRFLRPVLAAAASVALVFASVASGAPHAAAAPGDPSAAQSTFAVSPAADTSDQSTWVEAGGSYTVTMTAKDANNDLLPGLDTSLIDFTASSTNVTVGDVTDNGDGTYSATLTAVVADSSYTVSADVNSAAVSAQDGTSSIPIPFKAGPPVEDNPGDSCPPTSVDLSVDQTELAVGQSATVTAFVSECMFNPVSGQQVTFVVSGDAALSSSSATVGPDGFASVTVMDTTAEVVTITVTPPANAQLPLAAGSVTSTQVTFVAPPLSEPGLELSVSPLADPADQSTWVAAGDSYLLTMVPQGRSTTASDIVVTPSSPNVTVGVVTDNGDGTYSATLTAIVADPSYTVTASDPGFIVYTTQGSGGSSVPIPFKAGPPDPGTWPTATLAYDFTSGVATVTALEPSHAPFPGVSVTFAVAGKATVGGASSATVVTDDQGVATAQVVAQTDACGMSELGSLSATAEMQDGTSITVDGSPMVFDRPAVVCNPTMTFAVSPAVSTSDQSNWQVADGGSSYSGIVTVTDANGNPMTNLDPSDFTFSASSSAVHVSDPPVNNHDGTYAVVFNSTVADATDTVYANYQGDAIAGGTPQPIPFKAGAPAAGPFTCADGREGTHLSAYPTSLVVGNDSFVTALVTDAKCNPVQGATVSFGQTGSAVAAPTGVPYTTNANGVTTARYRGYSAGLDTFSASIIGAGTNIGSVGVTWGDGALPTATLTYDAGTTTATVAVVDSFGAPVVSADVTLTVGGGASIPPDWGSSRELFTGLDGKATFDVTPPAYQCGTATSFSVSATATWIGAAGSSADVSTLTVANSPLTFPVVPPAGACGPVSSDGFSASESSFSVVEQNDPLHWGCITTPSRYVGTLTARDSQGNLLTDLDLSRIAFAIESGNVSGSYPAGVGVSSVVNAGDGTYTVTFAPSGMGPNSGVDATASVTYDGSDKVADGSGNTDVPIPFGTLCWDGPYQYAGDAALSYDATSRVATVTVLGPGAGPGLGSPLPGATVTFTVSGATINGAATATVTSDAQGVATVDVTPGVNACGGPASMDLSATAAAPNGWAIAVIGSPVVTTAPAVCGSATAALAYDATSGKATVTVLDSSGDPLPGASVTFSVDSGATIGDGTSGTVVTNDQGVAAVDVTSHLSSCGGPNHFTITATAVAPAPDGTPITVGGSPFVSPSIPPSPGDCWGTMTIDMTPTNGSPVYANGTDSWTATITLTSWDGQPQIGGADGFRDIQATNTATGSPMASVKASPVTDNGDGTYTVYLTSTTSGTFTVSAAWGDKGATSSPITFTLNLPSVDSIVVSGSATVGSTLTAVASGISPAGAAVSYQWYRCAPGFIASGACSAISKATGTTYTVTSSDVGDKVLCAVTVSAPNYLTLIFDDLDVGMTGVVPAPSPTASLAYDAAGQVASVTVTDAAGAPVSGATVTFTSDGGATVGGKTADAVLTNDQGVATATVVPPAYVCGTAVAWSIAASTTLSTGPVSVDGSPLDLTVTPPADACKATPAVPAPPTVDATNGSLVTGTGTPGNTIQIKDGSGNPIEGCESTTVDSTGHFACVPTTPPMPGVSLLVTQTDATGTSSAAATVTVGALRIVIAQYGIYAFSQREQTVTGSAFNPGERVHLVVESTPWDLGYQTADATGTVVFTFTVPTTFPAGTHTATLTGDQSGTIADTFLVMAPYCDVGCDVPGGHTSTPTVVAGGSVVSSVAGLAAGSGLLGLLGVWVGIAALRRRDEVE